MSLRQLSKSRDEQGPERGYIEHHKRATVEYKEKASSLQPPRHPFCPVPMEFRFDNFTRCHRGIYDEATRPPRRA